MLILSAGMAGAGSTWLYNTLRYAYLNAGMHVYGCFADSYDAQVRADVHVVKIHAYDDSLRQAADLVFTMRRDMAQAAASWVRRRMVEMNAEAIEQRVRSELAANLAWSPYSAAQIDYALMMRHPRTSTCRLLCALGLFGKADAQEIMRDVEKLGLCVSPTVDQTTQLWPNHRGTAPTVLPKAIIRRIRAVEKEFDGIANP